MTKVLGLSERRLRGVLLVLTGVLLEVTMAAIGGWIHDKSRAHHALHTVISAPLTVLVISTGILGLVSIINGAYMTTTTS